MDMKIFEIKEKIVKLKIKLNETDYLAIKYAEGVITLADYLETKQQRQAWRDEINMLEEQLKLVRGE